MWPDLTWTVTKLCVTWPELPLSSVCDLTGNFIFPGFAFPYYKMKYTWNPVSWVCGLLSWPGVHCVMPQSGQVIYGLTSVRLCIGVRPWMMWHNSQVMHCLTLVRLCMVWRQSGYAWSAITVRLCMVWHNSQVMHSLTLVRLCMVWCHSQVMHGLPSQSGYAWCDTTVRLCIVWH